MWAEATLKILWSTLALGITWFIVVAYRSFLKQRNEVRSKEISLVGQKIAFDNNIKPLSELISESNREHGAVGQPPGDKPKQE